MHAGVAIVGSLVVLSGAFFANVLTGEDVEVAAPTTEAAVPMPSPVELQPPRDFDIAEKPIRVILPSPYQATR